MNTSNEPSGRAEIVIVGAGIVGCSTAYHLAQYDRGDVTVVDTGPIPKTGGSTVHAPAGLTQTSPNRTMSLLAQETRDVYEQCGGWEDNGSIEIATTDDRWNFLERRMDQAQACGVEDGELLTPAEVADLVPLIDEERILGGYYVPTDGRIDTIAVLDWLTTEAESHGVTFRERTTVTDIETTDGAVRAVVTDRGRIETKEVLVAGNIWSPLIGDMVGVDVPLVPCAHQYAVTESVEELEGWDHDIEQPWVRHGDAELYYRQHGSGYGIGNYNHEPLVVDPSDIDGYDDAIEEEPVYDYVPERGSRHEAFKQPSVRPFTEEHFDAAWRETTRLFPSLEGTDIARGFNGMFSFTPDHMPILGESPTVDGFWVAAAVWLTHGGAVGRVMADLMETGRTDLDIDPAHIARFQPHAGSPDFVRDRGSVVYDTVYDVHHPRGSFRTHRDLRRSPAYPYQEELDATFYDGDGWERVRWYGANESLLDEYSVHDRAGWAARHWSPIEGAEHQAVRDRVGLSDQTAATIIEISGADAPEFVQYAFAGNMDLPVGRTADATMLNEGGRVVGTMTVARIDRDRFIVRTDGGARGTIQFDRLQRRCSTEYSATVSNETSAVCTLGVHGPEAPQTLDAVVHADIDALEGRTVAETYADSVPVTVLWSPDTGEPGWEVHAPTEYGGKLWDTIWDAGQRADISPLGDGALDTLGLEAGKPRFGTDVTPEHTPHEAGLEDTVDLDTDFVGRDALLAGGRSDPETRLMCLTLDDPEGIVLAGTPMLDEGRNVGYVTSAGYGHSIGTCIVYGYLPRECAEPGTSLEIQFENDRYGATVREEPLVDSGRGT